MEDYNKRIDDICSRKMKEIEDILFNKEKNRKMMKNKDDINYSVKTTVGRIVAEQERKLKLSKAYKNAQNTVYVQAIEEMQKETKST